ncbi:MAG TPA: 5-oxoprolinase subunit PxpA [Gemmatimonadaceae bacterium]|nr:5-oxoprolinase subunit PxpA [Gemmatimonadaceae bacterium]
MHRVDLNCDMGESFGAWAMGADDEILPYITSANIACGFHAGDPGVMRRTVSAAVARGVAVGAHPGLPDLVGFGRRTMDVTPDEVYELVVYQTGALRGFAMAAGVALQHVKAHGALYNMAAAQPKLADAIACAVRDVDRELVLYGLAGSHLVSAGERAGLQTASEAFADRNYLGDGSLVPRRRADAMVSDAPEAARRAVRMVKEGRVRSVDGADIAIRADTICIHGDGPHAAEFARALRSALEAEGIEVSPAKRGATTS